MTMATGVNFTSLQISQLPDDPTKPMYLFDSEQWDKAPTVLAMEMDENISPPTRNSKNDKYKEQNGDVLMWNRYVAFGYYHTKNIYDFIEKWEHASTSIFDVCKMVWREYSNYLIRQANPTNPQLMVWTLNIALPFLFNHDPDYHLASILDIEEATNTKLPSYITNPNTWLQIGKKKKKSPPNSPVSPAKQTPPSVALQPLSTNKPSSYSTLQPLGKTVRHSRNSTPPINQPATHSFANHMIVSETTNASRSTSSSTVLDDSPGISPNNSSEKRDLDLSLEDDKSNKDSPEPREHHPVVESIPDTPLDQQNPQTDPINTSSQPTKNQIHNPYQQPRKTGAPVTQSPGNPVYSHHQDNASSVNQSTLNTKLAPFVAINDGTHRLTLRWKPNEYHELATDHEYWINKVYGLIHLLFGP